MVKMYSRLGNVAGRTLLVAAMTGLLVGCGGSSGDTVPLGEQDFDGDEIINSEDPDADGDDILDTEDNFVDLDGDGLDDVTLQTEAEANGTQFVEVSDDNVCGSEDGLDNSSVNDPWNDNCEVKRFGQFADSLFAVGIQRVLFCEGHGTGTDYTVFADGEFGPGSETAAKAFQRDDEDVLDVTLVDDGIIGPATWGALQTRIKVLEEGITGQTPDTWGFDTGVCAGIPMFYQETMALPDNSGIIGGRWTLAKNQPNTDQETPFSWEEPFGRL